MREKAKVRDEADPFARLHPGRRLFLPSLTPDGGDDLEGHFLTLGYFASDGNDLAFMTVNVSWFEQSTSCHE